MEDVLVLPVVRMCYAPPGDELKRLFRVAAPPY
jgi:hypothetical protein